MKFYLRLFLSTLASIILNSTISAQTQDNWIAPKEANDLVNPLAGLQPTPAAKQLFVTNCVPCHGDKGKGDGPAGASLNPRPYNLTISKVDNETDGSLFWRITNGHSSMPTFKATLTPTQRWQVVIYIRSLQQQAAEVTKSKQKKSKS